MKDMYYFVIIALVVAFISWTVLVPRDSKFADSDAFGERITNEPVKLGITKDRINYNRVNPAEIAESENDPELRYQKELVIAVQQQLYSEGYLDQAPTGRMDRDTTEALTSFQKVNKLESTGELNYETLISLRLITPSSEYAE